MDITHDNVCSSVQSCFYSHLLSTGRPISSFHPWCPDGWAGVQAGGREIVCPGCISETLRCRKLILGRDIG